MNRVFLFLLLSLIGFSDVLAQSTKTDFLPNGIGLTVGYAKARSHFLQLGAILGDNYGSMHQSFNGLRFGIGADIGRGKGDWLVGPKAFVETEFFVLLGTRLTVVDYMKSGQHDLRLLPEAGISAFGYGSIMYGYGIPLNKSELEQVSRHRISFAVNLPIF